jgi:hypothetical protein
MLENSTPQLIPEDADYAVQMREKLVRQLSASGITVTRRVRRGKETDNVDQVLVGSARARTSYKISQRIAAEIPEIGDMYAGLSLAAHGESLHVANAWELPDAFARRIGFVVHWSAMAWSKAIHRWVDVVPGPVETDEYLKDLRRSIHPDIVAAIVARGEVFPN